MKHILKHTLWAILSLFITACVILGLMIIFFEMQLPNVTTLKEVHLQVPLNIYTKDGKLIAEYGEMRRYPVNIQDIPKPLIEAVLATEDQHYYDHPGIDPEGLVRAAINLLHTGKKSEGGSTITMQVARNFFLTRQKTFSRKFKEILLAIKIDSTFSKEKILELYLNEIYLGNRAYGMSAAAQVYYGKSLNQLSLPELAMLAGLPKAPSTLNPLANPAAAKDRRNHVLARMLEWKYITKKQYQHAIQAPISTSYHGEPIDIDARYIAELIRDAMVEQYGDNAYTGGFKVYTTISSHEQTIANNAVHNTLIAYDQRHGYRGPITNWGAAYDSQTINKWAEQLKQIPTINGLIPAAVVSVNGTSINAVLGNGNIITVPWEGLQWARKSVKGSPLGPAPTKASDILKVGDQIRVQATSDYNWRLTQIPQVEGALVSINPNNGAILSLVGGFDFYSSSYNRAVQAERQPGSNFKPFLYAAAFEKGYTLASVINDAPVVIYDKGSQSIWRPQNDTHRFYGPTRLRVALNESRNVVSIRLLEDISPSFLVKFVTRFGFDPNKQPKSLSLALGTGLATPLEVATAYAVFANGGYKINPYLIDHITNPQGTIIYQANPKIACSNCVSVGNDQGQNPIAPQAQAPRIISPQIAYLINSALQTVIEHGTGHAALVLKRRDLAGKTGTSSDFMDAWFSGFNSNVVTTAWVGYDQPQSLEEYGAQAALPMWIEYMGAVLSGKPEQSMAQPPGIVTVKIDPRTGLLAPAGDRDAIFEVFSEDHVPKQTAPSSADSNGNTLVNPNDLWKQPLF